MVSIDLQSFGKICQKMTHFWPKNRVFYRFSKIVLVFFFKRKTLLLGKWSNWLTNWYRCSLGYVNKFVYRFFDFLLCSLFIGPEICQTGNFGSKLAIFTPKCPYQQLSGAIKRQQIKNSKKWYTIFFL